MISFSQLIVPLTPAQVLADLTAAVQGIGQILQLGVGNAAAIGTGNISGSGAAAISASVIIRIDTTGSLGTGVFSYSLNNGLTFVTGNTIPASGVFVLPGTGVTITFAAGAYNTSTSFLAGESYVFLLTPPSFPVSNWAPFATGLSILEAEAVTLANWTIFVAGIAGGSTTQTAQGGYADNLGQGAYVLSRNAGQATIGTAPISAAPGSGPFTINAGQLIASRIDNGLLYTNTNAGTIPAGPWTAVTHTGSGPSGVTVSGQTSAPYALTVFITGSGPLGTSTFSFQLYAGGPVFAAGLIPNSGSFTIVGTPITINFPTGSYVNGDTYSANAQFFAAQWRAVNVGAVFNALTHVSGSPVLTLNSAPAGAVIDNPPMLGTVNHAGTGTGAVALAGIPSADMQVIIRIMGVLGASPAPSGPASTTSFQYSANGGATYAGPFPCSAGLSLNGVAVSFTGGASNSFVQGDLYTFSTSWITQQGVDAESTGAYMTRCNLQWATLAGPTPPSLTYQAYARAASMEVLSATAAPDPVIPGQVDITLAGLSGGVSASAIAAVQSYVTARVMGISILTGSVQNQNVALAGTLYVKKQYAAGALAFLQGALIPLGLSINTGGTVYFDGNASNAPKAVIQTIPGFDHMEGFTINGASSDVLIVAPFFPVFQTAGITVIGI